MNLICLITVPPAIHGLENITIVDGMPATFAVEICGHPFPEISWSKDGEYLNLEDDLITMTPSEKAITLHIAKARASDSGEYKLELKNEVGNTASLANLVVHGRIFQKL